MYFFCYDCPIQFLVHIVSTTSDFLPHTNPSSISYAMNTMFCTEIDSDIALLHQAQACVLT